MPPARRYSRVRRGRHRLCYKSCKFTVGFVTRPCQIDRRTIGPKAPSDWWRADFEILVERRRDAPVSRAVNTRPRCQEFATTARVADTRMRYSEWLRRAGRGQGPDRPQARMIGQCGRYEADERCGTTAPFVGVLRAVVGGATARRWRRRER